MESAPSKTLIFLQSTRCGGAEVYMGSCCVLDVSFALIRNIKKIPKCSFDDAISANMIIADPKWLFSGCFYCGIYNGLLDLESERSLSN